MKRTDSKFWNEMKKHGQKAETKAVKSAVTRDERKSLDDGFAALAKANGVIRR